ncbi:MAG TPA: ABC transporter permease subunit [Candidatus Dormibacteraeota bacterium]|nr:ABC transporter permease subunit [Candidatus Dormibacteraeota bacterium]
MLWLNLSLIAFIVSLVVAIVFARWPRLWTSGRIVALFAFQLSGILLVTWLLVAVVQPPALPGRVRAGPTTVAGDWHQVLKVVLIAAERSFALIAVAITAGTVAGLGASLAITVLRRRRLLAIAPLVTVFWVVPTFLFAILAQEAQFLIYDTFNLRVSGGYGEVSIGQIFWAALVLGVRPAAYIFRQTRVALEQESTMDHVRAAEARGLPWRAVALRYIIRPTAPSLLATWGSSLRLMIGSLPLVEFFFAYPGLGYTLLLSLGIAPGTTAPAPNADLAIALVVAMAGLLVLLESLTSLLQGWLDPRIRELRLEQA